MKEKDLNTIITNGFKEIGMAHKISDPMGGVGGQLPFDGFSVCLQNVIFFESKIIKPLKAWNFNSIEDHQYDNLNFIKKEKSDTLCLYTIGAFEPRKYFYLFVFDSSLVKYLREQGKKSILKKEFENLMSNSLLLNISRKDKKYNIDFSNLLSIIIDKEKWEAINA